jgi:hypothetical protein
MVVVILAPSNLFSSALPSAVLTEEKADIPPTAAPPEIFKKSLREILINPS